METVIHDIPCFAQACRFAGMLQIAEYLRLTGDTFKVRREGEFWQVIRL